MNSFWIATAIVTAPLLAGLFAVASRDRRALAASVAVAGAAASFVGAVALLPRSLTEPATVSLGWVEGLGLAISWRLEPASLGLAALVAGIGAVVLSYAGHYFRASDRGARGIGFMACFLAAMLGLVLAGDLYSLFVFWELTGVFSFLLIGLHRASEEAWAAARQALVVTVGGGLPFLAGIVWLDLRVGTTRLDELVARPLSADEATLFLALVLPAALTKSASLPFSPWLPRAMAAPTPASALLHSATLVKAGIVLLLYLAPVLRSAPLWSAALVPLGAATCLWGAYRALTVFDLKRLLAFSTVSQLGLLTLTLGIGTDFAIRAAILHLGAHAVFKAGLFLAAGNIEERAGTRDLARLGGLVRREPLLAGATVLLAASMAGVPPLAGFLSKELILKSVLAVPTALGVIATVGVVIGSLGTVVYSARIVFGVFFGEPRAESAVPSDRSLFGLAPCLLLAGISLVAGLSPPWVEAGFLRPIFESTLGGAPTEKIKPLALWYGVDGALLTSVGLLVIGAVGYLGAGLRALPAGADRPLGAVFDRLLAASLAFGRGVEEQIALRRPALYFGALLVALVALVGTAIPPSGWGELGGVSASEAILCVLLAAALGAVLGLRSRLGRVLALSAVGLVVALFFRSLAAPDLLLTQVSVEVVTTVLFATALSRLPSRTGIPARIVSLRGAVALGFGGTLALLSLGPKGSGGGELGRSLVDAAPVVAAGKNVVNVILTDFRALDTLVETLVIAVAAIAAVELLPVPRRDATYRRLRLLSTVMPWISWTGVLFATALLMKGHDQPGGGFVAGLVAGVIWIIRYYAVSTDARGESADDASNPLRIAMRWGIAGLGIALLWPVIGSLAPLTHRFGTVEAISLKWHTALFFDAAIASVVASGIVLAARRLDRGESS